MKELNTYEIKEVNGGFGFLAAIGVTGLIYEFSRGFRDGYNS